MKITNKETIRAGEREFIDNINAELDWEAIETLLLEKHNFSLEDEVDYQKGDLVVFNDQIAYKFDFHIKVPLSVVFGRDGNCLEISTAGFEDKEPQTDISPEDTVSTTTSSISTTQVSPGMVSSIAELISDINQGDDDE